MKRLLALFAFAFAAFGTTLTGTLYSPLGGTLSGTLTLSPPPSSTLTPACAGGQAGLPGPQALITIQVVGGVLQSPPAITGNDCLLPVGTSYGVTFSDTSGNSFIGSWRITGATFDVTTFSVNAGGASQTLVMLQPTGDQLISQPVGSSLRVNNLQVTSLLKIPEFVYAGLPGSPTVGQLVMVTDAASAGNCSGGGGAAASLCRWSGSAWLSPAGAGGGGGGGNVSTSGTPTTGSLPKFASSTTIGNATLDTDYQGAIVHTFVSACNGTADDSTEGATAASTPGIWYFPKNATCILGNINVTTPGVAFIGQNTTLKHLATDTANYMIYVSGGDGFTFKGFNVDENGVALTMTNKYVMQVSAKNIDIENNTFLNSGTAQPAVGGIILNNNAGTVGSTGVVKNNTFQNTILGYTVYSYAAPAGQTTIEGNNIAGSAYAGIMSNFASAQNYTLIRGNTITAVTAQSGDTGQTGNGVLIYNANVGSRTEVSGNYVYTPQFSCVRNNNSNNVSILDNHCDGAGETGIYDELGALGNVVAGNVVTNSAKGITNTNIPALGTSQPDIIVNNVLYNIRTEAIHAENAMVSGNTITQSAVGIQMGYGGTGYGITLGTNSCNRCGINVGVDKDLNSTPIDQIGFQNIQNPINTSLTAAVTPVQASVALNVTAATPANPLQLTLASAATANAVYIMEGFYGMTQANGVLCTASAASTSITCTGLDGSTWSALASNPASTVVPQLFLVYSSGTTLAWSVPATVKVGTQISGHGGLIATLSGTFTNGNCIKALVSGGLVDLQDAGATCGTGTGGIGGSGTVGTLPIYVTNTTTLGNSNVTQNATDGTVLPTKSLSLPVQSVTPTFGGTTNLDFSAGNVINMGTLTGNTTLAITAGTNHAGGPWFLLQTQDGTGSRQYTYPATFKNFPQPDPTTNATSAIGPIYSDGTNFWIPGSTTAGLLALGPASASCTTPPTGSLSVCLDSTTLNLIVKDVSGNTYQPVKTGGAILPGSGLTNITINAQTGTTYPIASSDQNKQVTFSNAAAIAVTLPQSGSVGFPAGWWMIAKNIGVGDVTITPTTSTISGAPNIVLSTGEFAVITSDGTNYEAETNRLIPGTNVTLTKVRTGTTVSSTGGGSTINGIWWPGGQCSYCVAANGLANGVYAYLFTLPTALATKYLNFNVKTACTGTCGVLFGIQSADKSTQLCKTIVGYNGIGTANEDPTTGGGKSLPWTTGSDVSAGVCTLPAGNYWLWWTQDNATVAYSAGHDADGTFAANGQSVTFGYQSSASTGTGSSLAFTGAIGTLSAYSGTGYVSVALSYQ
ncbi:MAG: right-handed parallel beta-helix repeat-containing protein [Patescibacteria group bacterium]|nr:right-handed parallel beta-helix repeat-containing protein [Patescibacteria group bacterium]